MWAGCRRFLLPYRLGCRGGATHTRSRAGVLAGIISVFCIEDQIAVLAAILQFFRALFNPDGLRELIRAGGSPLICTIVFVETGFFVGFFLPGDSLLVTAGILSAGGVIPLKLLLLPVMLCAIVGDQIGYWIGRSAGAALYRREDSFFFRRSHLERANDFYEKYGGRAVILARFVPIVRTFCPPVAGAAKMPYSSYVAFDICGGIFWVATMILAGYTLGRSVPNIGARIHYVIGVVIVVSVLPAVISIYRSRHKFSASGDQGSAATPRAKGE